MKRPRTIYISGLTDLASAIEAEFKILCTKQLIQSWRKHNPPFPSPHASMGYDRELCFQWVRDNKGSIAGTSEADLAKLLTAKQRIENARANREEWKFKQEQGLYLERMIANRTIAALVKEFHSFTQKEIEKYGPDTRRDKLKIMGVSEEIVALFFEWDIIESRSTLDRIEDKAEKLAKKKL